jgi:ubiquinone/menaquinone biosynthesis C-methylase UbiE
MDGTIGGEYTEDMPGRKQPQPFNAERAAVLDDPQRERWLPSERIVEFLDVCAGMRVLDYGTGSGRYAIAIARAHPDAEIAAFDIQQPMLDIVKERTANAGLKNIRTLGPAPQAPASNSFDRALGIHILHEIDDEHVGQVRESLKPDGIFLVVDWDRRVKRNFGPPADHVHSAEEALERLRRCGLQPEPLPAPEFPYHFVIRAFR